MSASSRPSILLATYAAHPELTADDQLLAAALEGRGVDVRAAAWDDRSIRWSDAAAVIVRSTWDYHLRRGEFLAWTGDVAARGALHNAATVIRWNSHKGYLSELASRGIPVIDTVFASGGSRLDVGELAAAHGWDDVVIKPAVSASAHETRHFPLSERAAGQDHLDRLLSVGDGMLQPYVPTLRERGELSLMFARGTFTHAVRRRSALAGETVMPKAALEAAPRAALQCAERVLAESAALVDMGVGPLYARVDLAETPGGGFQLLELELIEPSLFFTHAPRAAERMATAVMELL
jgi:hypothetical protein